MCVSPILIPNPTRNPLFDRGETCKHHDTESLYIKVPCRVCHECATQRQNDIVQRVYAESFTSFMFMFTLTYNDKYIPFLRTSEGNYAYPDPADVTSMFRRIRKSRPFPYKFKYLFVSEYGGKYHRPHFHGILFFDKSYFSHPDKNVTLANLRNFERSLHDILLGNWCVNVSSNRKPCYEPLCTYVRKGNRSNFDTHFIDNISSSCSSQSTAMYVTKYMCKESDWLKSFKGYLWHTFPHDVAYRYWKYIRPVIRCSINLGISRLSAHYIDECFTKSFPSGKILFYLPDGRGVPMSKYFLDKFIPLKCRPIPDSLSDKSIVTYDKRTSQSRIASINRNANKLQKNLEHSEIIL